MKKFYLKGYTTTIYSAIVEAETEEEAHEYFDCMSGYDLDNFCMEETGVEIIESEEIEYKPEQWAIPLLRRK